MKPAIGVLAAVLVLAVVSAASAQSGAAGTWDLSMSTPQGTNTIGLSLKVDGDKVSGELNGPMGAVRVQGAATGGGVRVVADVNIQGIALPLTIDGKIDGDTMAGNVKVGDFGEFPFTGKRAAAAPDAAAATLSAAGAVAGGAVITDLNGKWDIKLVIAGMGEVPATAVLKQVDENVSGTISSLGGDVAIAGTVTGRSVKFAFEAETPQGKLPITMSGAIGATSVIGKASIAGLGEADWTATRSAVQ